MKQKKEQTTNTRSVEVLNHFHCAKCNKWWSIGDAPKQKKLWYCPWCGTIGKYEKN